MTEDNLGAALSLRGIAKTYPNGTIALRGVSFDVARGSIHAVVGENGAGKSTLMRIIAGLEQPTAGTISLGVGSVGMVHQHFSLVPSFTVAEAVALGTEPRRGGLLDRRAAAALVRELSSRYDLDVEPEARVRDLSIAARQKVEILKALARNAALLILDEPTAVVSPPEVAELFRRLALMRDEGRTLLFISHKVGEVLSLADEVTAIRDGRVEGGGPVAGLTPDTLTRLVMGREVTPARRTPRRAGEPRLRLEQVSLGADDPADRLGAVTFDVAAGEVVGVAGVDGNGQRGLARVLSGARAPDRGRITLDGAEMTRAGTAAWRRAGLAHLPADRFVEGGAAGLSLRDNAIAGSDADPSMRWGLFLRPAAVRARTQALLDRLSVRHGGEGQPLGSLSGGNAQKLIAARELQGYPTLVLADQPTRGIDVATSATLHAMLDATARDGAAVLVISADLDELLRICDRIVVLSRGRVAADLPNGPDVTPERLGRAMLGLEAA